MSAHKARITANAPMDYAGQQPFAMTYTLLIVHGYGMPTSCREITGAKNKHHTSSFPSYSHGPCSRGPRFIPPGPPGLDIRQVYVHDERSVLQGKLLPSQQRSVKSPTCRAWLHGSVSKAAAEYTPCARTQCGTTCTQTIERRGFPAGLFPSWRATTPATSVVTSHSRGRPATG